jgi:hypothetical protein
MVSNSNLSKGQAELLNTLALHASAENQGNRNPN